MLGRYEDWSTMTQRILGIESSCDDTGVAVVDAHTDGRVTVLSNAITGQDHVRTGGVVPEIAARHHAEAIMPTLERALSDAQTSLDEIDVLAMTRGPGMIGCLLVGVETARTIAAARHIPIIGVNHMEAHIASTFVDHPHIGFPAVALLASGGHTMLVGVTAQREYRLIGTTRDDAAGEAFDKVAKMLGLSYPGGPALARLAERGNPHAYPFPTPMLTSDNFDFSFAGLKTAILYHIRDHQPVTEQAKADIAASFQESVVQVLVAKTVRAASVHDARTVILGGGVSANAALRSRLTLAMQEMRPNTAVVVPSPGLFTDNGAMIAVAAAPRALAQQFDDWRSISVDPQLQLPYQ